MHILLIGPRGDDGDARSARVDLAGLATAAIAAGERVSWLGTADDLGLPDGAQVERIATASRAPGFRRVEARLTDAPRERALCKALREAPCDLVHVHGFGGAFSYLLPWLADRLGVPVVVLAAPIEPVLCHRGTLVHARGAPCRQWDDALRCARCCRTRSADGLGGAASMLAGLCRPLRGLSPFPHKTAFLNRLDMLAQGLGVARTVVVADAAARDAILGLGVQERVVRCGVPSDASGWLDLWRAALPSRPPAPT